MQNLRENLAILTGGIVLSLIGISYVVGFLGPQDKGVVIWGYLSLYLGIAALLMAFFPANTVFTRLTFLAAALIQVLPIRFWYLAGEGIIGKWAYLGAHLLALVVFIGVFIDSMRRSQKAKRTI